MEKQTNGTRTYKDLMIWIKSIDLVTYLYKVTAEFPKNELFGITSQIRRASVSIPSNIFEVQTQLIIANNLGYLQQSNFERLFEISREIERMMCCFIDHLKNK
jgi:hypothetical protein